MKFEVTNHAIQRWRERVSIESDEKVDKLLDSLGQAVKLQGVPPKGLAHYRNGYILFVVYTDQWKSTVITVIDESPKIQNEIKTEYYNPDNDEMVYATFDNVMDRRAWLNGELRVVERMDSKDEYVKQRRKWIQDKFTETRTEWEQIKFLKKIEQESKRRQKEKDDEWEQWSREERQKRVLP